MRWVRYAAACLTPSVRGTLRVSTRTAARSTLAPPVNESSNGNHSSTSKRNGTIRANRAPRIVERFHSVETTSAENDGRYVAYRGYSQMSQPRTRLFTASTSHLHRRATNAPRRDNSHAPAVPHWRRQPLPHRQRVALPTATAQTPQRHKQRPAKRRAKYTAGHTTTYQRCSSRPLFNHSNHQPRHAIVKTKTQNRIPHHFPPLTSSAIASAKAVLFRSRANCSTVWSPWVTPRSRDG